jgi:hypothetical protein
MSQPLPTKIGSRVHPLSDPEGTYAELTENGWVTNDGGYRYEFPELAFGEFEVLEPAER